MRGSTLRRAGIGALAVAAIGAGTAVALNVGGGDGAGSGAKAAGSQTGLDTATVETRDMTRTTDLDGSVGRGDARPVPLSAHGTLTGLPHVGDVVANGQAIAEVDGVPIIVLTGDRPAWRDLQPGMTKGEDVRQLETALVALGYADASDLTVDDTWTADTTAAVKEMQEALGLAKDGRLSLGEIVFAPASMRVASVDGVLGDAPSAAGIKVTADEQVITARVDADDADLVAVGDVVDVELPTHDHVDGTVTEVGAPTAAQDGSVSIPLTITVTGVDVLDGTSVEIHVAEVAAAGATAVPAPALLALAEGGYAVEVPDASSPTGRRLVGVEVGMFADGWVQITGDVKAGDKVVVP